MALTRQQKMMAGTPLVLRLAEMVASLLSSGRRRMFQDFHAAALFGAVRAAGSFRKGKGAAWRTHLFNNMRWAILDWIREMGPLGYKRTIRRDGGTAPTVSTFSACTVTGTVGGEPKPDEEFIFDSAPPVDDALETEDSLHGILGLVLTDKPREALTIYYTHAGIPLKAVGAKMGLGESMASRLVTNAMQQIRKAMK